MILDLFHGTDAACAETIMINGFKCNKSIEHWLGNGIYFYLDEGLAIWWTTRPTNKYGTNITKPAIVKCTIELSENKILDLRKINDYKKVVDLFKDFYNTYIIYKGDKIPTMEQIRSAFFDFCYIYYKYDAIIGNFYLPNQPYLEGISKGYFKDTHLEYIETQICINLDKQGELIKSKKIYNIGSVK